MDETEMDAIAHFFFGLGPRGIELVRFEIKLGNSQYRGIQARLESSNRDDEEAIIRFFRIPLSDVPNEYLVNETLRLLTPFVRGERRTQFTWEQVDSMMTALRNMRHHDGRPADIFDWFVALSAISATEAAAQELGNFASEEEFGPHP